MSDTPRTDDRIVVVTMLQSHPKMEMVNAPFARELERELNAEKQHVTELEGRLRILWDKLEGERKHYQERIKLMEEALECVVVGCKDLHHKKKHQHRSGEPCPVEQLVRNAKEARP